MDRKLDELLFALTQNMTIAVSGEKLARDLGVSHSTLARWIEKLRASGVEIRGELFTGYRLTRLPDVLLPQLIRPRLRTLTLGRSIAHFYSVDSTNAFAARLFEHKKKVPAGTLVIAETQTAGRGRLGRTWFSESETGLYFSLILHPQIPPSMAPLFTLGAAVAMHDAIERQSHLAADIKWPNDILVGGKKVCGILAELQAEVDRVHTLVVGIGVNVNQTEFPEDLQGLASSLRMESSRSQSRVEILIEFLEQFEHLLARFEREGPAAIVAEWTTRSSYAHGRRLTVHDGFRLIDGVTRGLNSYGALRLESADGKVQDVYSGELLSSSAE